MGPRGRAGLRGGSRGGARGRGQGRGGFSRGGSRGGGRGGSRGGGRGGGRGTSRGGRGGPSRPHRGRAFDSARVEYSDSEADSEEQEQGSEAEEEFEGFDDDDDDASDDEEDAKTAARPYMALIQSLNQDVDAPQAKRRKLDHQNNTAFDDPDTTQDMAEDVDLVEEPEEAADEQDAQGAFDEEDEDDEDEKAAASDPFEGHFAAYDEASIAKKIKAIEDAKWTNKKVVTKGTRTVLSEPDTGDESDPISAPAPISDPSDLSLKHRLKQSLEAQKTKFDAVEQSVAPYLFGYRDLLYCNRNLSNGKSLRRIACLHALNHVFKTRDRVIKNNAKLAHQGDSDLELRDQGFTRPKVLMILPTREACYKMVETMTAICQPETQENKKRFEDSYHDKDDRFSSGSAGDKKPADFKDLFAGNDDDMFRLGIKFTRKTMKFFAAFYNSDILLASPLGLRMAIGSEEGKKVEHDFLSSVEVVLVDQADALLMQNWEHMEFICEHLNLQPKDDHGCDFSRVRPWYLEDQARYFRQTVVLSQFNTPELAKLFRLHGRNWAGKARVEPEHPHGVLQDVGVRARQTFSRFDAASVEAEPDARFAYFTRAILPALAKQRTNKDSDGTLVFIPSYLDFVRVRNYLATHPAAADLTFGTISEYASVSEASRARSHFSAGRHKVLLYTERAHHFRRYVFKGVRRVVMYGLPDNPLFYNELVGANLARAEQDLAIEPGTGSVRVVFSKYDVLRLERIVGSQRVGKMIRERGDTFDFV